MNSTSAALNSVDYFVLFIFGISIFAGYMRGMIKEIVSLVTWVAASVISTLFSGKLATMFSGSASSAQNTVSTATGADVGGTVSAISIGASFITLFILTLVVGYIVNTVVVGIMGSASLSNRMLGALFGGIRGFILVILLMFIAELTPMGSQPAWAASQFVKSFQPLVSWVQKEVHPGLDKIREQAESAVQRATDGMQNVSGAIGGAVGGGQ